jgi:HD-GYP domain-containing protein (c-di-GMP phosphodiesterase class II)
MRLVRGAVADSTDNPQGPGTGKGADASLPELQPRREVPRRSSDRHLRSGVVITLVDAIALRDPATARHGAAVARYAAALARRVGCSEEAQRIVHTAGLLHDVGKFALSDAALGGGELSSEEWDVVRRLPQESAALVGRLEGYGPVAEIVLYHHERVDGNGYPAGLIAHEIPLLARILAVANVYDAITSAHGRRQPTSERDPIRELRRAAGSQLDGDLVSSFIALLADEPLAGDAVDFEAELDVERRGWSVDAA